MKSFKYLNEKGLLLLFFLTVLTFGLFFVKAMADEIKNDWIAPAAATKVKNPVVSNPLSLTEGKKIFTAQCLPCHGVNGLGDGPMGKILSTKPQNLTAPEVKAESDGALFWKITTGRKQMPHFDKNLTVKDRWSVIDYIRTLESK